MKFLKVYDTEAKHNVLIPIDRIKSIGVSKHGGSYILTDTESFFTDRQLDDIQSDVEALTRMGYCTCNGSPKGCERERFGQCGYHDSRLADQLGPVRKESWDDIEKGCMSTFHGGYRDSTEIAIFQHGMGTVFNMLRGAFLPAEKCRKGFRPSIPHYALCFFKDGDKWCAVFGDFNNLQESPAGFGDTFDEALNELQAAKKAASQTTSHQAGT